jgi:hypothetical protein
MLCYTQEADNPLGTDITARFAQQQLASLNCNASEHLLSACDGLSSSHSGSLVHADLCGLPNVRHNVWRHPQKTCLQARLHQVNMS